MTTTTFTLTVASASEPAWFAALGDLEWGAVALPAEGKHLTAARDAYSPPAYDWGFGGWEDVCIAWTGACVDQGAGEYLFVANGGHANWAGNEAYAVAIRSADPQWYRLLNRTPSAYIWTRETGIDNTLGGGGRIPNGYRAAFIDGRMRSAHGFATYYWHSNGKVWFSQQSSPTGDGPSTGHAWSFDRNFTGLATSPQQTPLAHTNDAGPWQWLGRTIDGSTATDAQHVNFGNGPCAALDPVTGLIWTVQETTCGRWASLNTANGQITPCDVQDIYANNYTAGWSAVVYDPEWDGANESTCRWRYLVLGDSSGFPGRLVMLNLKSANPYAANNSPKFSPTQNSGAWTSMPTNTTAYEDVDGLGAVYHPASKAILLASPASTYLNTGRNLIKLAVPLNGDGTFNTSGTWNYSSVVTSGLDPTTAATANAGAYSKFNIVHDMGGSRSAIVSCQGVDAATYVMPLPAGGV